MVDNDTLAEAMGHDAYAELTGLTVTKAEPGNVEVIMPVTPKILNGHGMVHGGALFTLADYAAAAASNLLGEPTMAANASISYLRAVGGGTVTARARVVKSGRRMKFMVVDILDETGELAAVFQAGAITVARKKANVQPPA